MSHPMNDEIFEKAFEAGKDAGYTEALKNLLKFIDINIETFNAGTKLLKYIGKELEGKK